MSPTRPVAPPASAAYNPPMELAALTLALSVLWPQPRQAAPAPDTLLRLPICVVASEGLQAPADMLRRELAESLGESALSATPGGGSTVRLSLDPTTLTRPEEYALEPSGETVELRAHDARGAFWAAHSFLALLSRARAVPGGYQVTVPRLRDWPESSFRAFMIQGAWTPDSDELKHNLELMARQHITYFALEFGYQVVLDFDPDIAAGGRFSKAQAREIVDYGRSLGMEPIGYLNLLGHLERAYNKPPYTLHGGIDIRSDEAYEKFVYPTLDEMLQVYGPVEYFHCGMDEAWELFEWLSGEGEDVTALLARHIQRVNDYLKTRGVKMVIWHDMLIAPALHDELGAPVGPANGGPPQNTAGALALIPRDVILDYWFYDPLAAYPALDYLQRQGFTLWASPWQSPFSLCRYASARQVPVMGTLWAGPPPCFESPTYNPVTGLYAQAAWNPAAASEAVAPEPELSAAARGATCATLYRRRSLSFPGSRALLLSRSSRREVAFTAPEVEQHAGVPLDTSAPDRIAPLEALSKPFTGLEPAASVRLPGGVTLTLDGLNAGRGEDQLILYSAPRTSTGTNIYGTEVAVSASGTVLEAVGYGSGDHAIPAGGFVLSAHSGRDGRNDRALQALRVGDTVAVLNAAGEWVGGAAPTSLLAELPGGQVLRIDAQDAPRGAASLALYHPGYGNGRTGTNQWGVEVCVEGGRVTQLRDNAGDTPIPAAGYILSAHGSSADSPRAAALRALAVGDPVRLLIERAGERHDLDQALAERAPHLPAERALRRSLRRPLHRHRHLAGRSLGRVAGALRRRPDRPPPGALRHRGGGPDLRSPHHHHRPGLAPGRPRSPLHGSGVGQPAPGRIDPRAGLHSFHRRPGAGRHPPRPNRRPALTAPAVRRRRAA